MGTSGANCQRKLPRCPVCQARKPTGTIPSRTIEEMEEADDDED
jgi:hypothetical protein